jgi:hypothetical protein
MSFKEKESGVTKSLLGALIRGVTALGALLPTHE